MKKVTLSKKEIKKINQEINELFGIEKFFSHSDFVVLAEDKYVLKDDEMCFFYEDDMLLPSLKLVLEDNFLRKVAVNMGAVPAMAGGADVMRPGIVAVDDGVEEGTIVAIVDENNRKAIAVGKSLFSKERIMEQEKGKMVLNLHHVGDDVWGFSAGA